MSRWKILILVKQSKPIPFPYDLDVTLRCPSHNEQRPEAEIFAQSDLRVHFRPINTGPCVLNLDAPRDTVTFKKPIEVLLCFPPSLALIRVHVRADDGETGAGCSKTKQALGVASNSSRDLRV